MTELSPRAQALLEAARSGDEPTQRERARVTGAVRAVLGAAALGAAVTTNASAHGAGGAAGAGSAAGGAGVSGALGAGRGSCSSADANVQTDAEAVCWLFAPCPTGTTWSMERCECEPDNAECTTDGDCRLEADYCTGCDCPALAPGEKIPACPGPGVQCFADPCFSRPCARKAAASRFRGELVVAATGRQRPVSRTPARR